MMAKVTVVAALFLVAIATIPGSAAAVPITVTVDGVQRTGNDSVVLASGATWATFGNLKIRARGGSGDAKVVAGNGSAGGQDGTEDELKFINAEIKRFQGSSAAEYHILFEGTFGIPPNTNNGAFSYELTGIGDIRTTSNNYIKATPHIESPTGTWTTWVPILSHTVSGANFTFFNSPNNITFRNFPTPTVTASRKLKVDVAFKLQSTSDLIKLGTASGIMLQDAPAHGCCDPPPLPPHKIVKDVSKLADRVLMLEELLRCIVSNEKIKPCLQPDLTPEQKEKLSNVPETKQ